MTEGTEPNEKGPSHATDAETAPAKPLPRGSVIRFAKSAGLLITSERAYRVAIILQLPVLVVSVYLIFNQLEQQAIRNQLEQQAMLTRAANTQALVNLVSPINLLAAQDREIAEIMLKGRKGFAKEVQKKEVDEDRYETILSSYLIFYENMYAQHQKKLLDDDVYKGWEEDLKAFVDRELLEKYWVEWKGLYQEAFSNYVTGLIKDKKDNQQKPAR